MKPTYVSPLTFLSALFLSHSVCGEKVKPSSFAASQSIPVESLLSAATKTNQVSNLAVYPVSIGSSASSTIYNDWASFDKGAALVWTADMDVDCDGLEYGCDGNPDGQPQTNWGALAAYDVPFIVIPDMFLSANQDALPGNNVAAVICNNKMYYAILGDSNHNDPQVTGEASWLLARTCFPDENLNGNKGHTATDVTYILFTGLDAVLPDKALDKHYVTDFYILRSMGDSLMTSLAQNLGLEPEKAPTPTPTPTPTPHDEPESSAESAYLSPPTMKALAVIVVAGVFISEIF